jgi:hypothetical protein
MASVLKTLEHPHQWKSHQGRRNRIRNLRHLCAPLLKSKDEATKEAIDRARLATSTEPEPEYGMLFLINRAREVAEDNHLGWTDALNTTLDMLIAATKVE